MQTFSVQPVSLPPATMNVREQVRALVARAAAAGHRMGLPNSWTAADPAFSRMLGAAGLLGITWPRKYGGGERYALERYVVLEELQIGRASGKERGCQTVRSRWSSEH